MDLRRAMEIFRLPDNYTEAELKKEYHTLAMKYHPDKNKNEDAKDMFTEIQAAYEFLNKPKPFETPLDDILSSIFKSFVAPMKSPVFKMTDTLITITAKEYLTGTVKTMDFQENCQCEQRLCTKCAGSGFYLENLNLSHCKECLGNGSFQSCQKCCFGVIKKQKKCTIPPKTTKLKNVIIEIEKPYFLKDRQLYLDFSISLKESLTGFSKLFKDPFGVSHTINVNKVIQMGDGYRVGDIILLFKVNYPKKLPIEVVEQLKKINFDGVDGRN